MDQQFTHPCFGYSPTRIWTTASCMAHCVDALHSTSLEQKKRMGLGFVCAINKISNLVIIKHPSSLCSPQNAKTPWVPAATREQHSGAPIQSKGKGGTIPPYFQ